MKACVAQNLCQWRWLRSRILLVVAIFDEMLVGNENNVAERRIADWQSLEDQASVFSRLTFSWVFPLLKLSFRNSSDLPKLPISDSPATLADAFHGIFGSRQIDKNSLLIGLLYKLQRPVFRYSLFSGWMFLLCMLLDPILLQHLLKNAENIEEHFDLASAHKMVLLVFALSLCMAIRVSNMETCFFSSVRTMNNARTAIVHAVFRRSMQRKSLDMPDIGYWSNLMSTDADKFGIMSCAQNSM